MADITVSSGDFLKAYGRYSETALHEPVSITSHGRERLVLLSAKEFRRLKALDRKAIFPWELDAADLAALEAATTPADAARFDYETSSE